LSGSSSSSWSSSSSGTQTSSWTSRGNAKPWHDKGRGPSRLAECSVSDAVGIAWGFVHAFCPQQLLLHELAGVLAARAGQLHAADVSRLLWAYATAEVGCLCVPMPNHCHMSSVNKTFVVCHQCS
jgi:hypothetical protein